MERSQALLGPRHRYYDFSKELWLQMFTQGNTIRHAVIEDGFPEDAKIVNIYDLQRTIRVCIESKSFDIVEKGKPIPEEVITLRAL